MFDPIPDPIPNKHVLDWAVPVTRALNGLRDKVGAPARNERDRRGASSPDMGCWKIVSNTREETGENEGEAVQNTVRIFANQFYLQGEVLHELELDDAVEDFVCQGELDDGEEYTAADKPYVALKVPATTNSTGEPALVGYKTLAELQTAQSDAAWVVKPLYKLTHDGSVAVDFRNCPALQVAEVLA
jgi:hypothetical protein